MKISDLILAVGDDNVKIQNLLEAAETVNKTKHGTQIVFFTNEVQAEELLFGHHSQTKNIGLVLWLPRDKVEAAVAAEKEKRKTWGITEETWREMEHET